MKPVGVKSNTYIDFGMENKFKDYKDHKDHKFKVGNHAIISKYENIFPKVHASNWYEEVSVIKKVKSTVLCTYVIKDLIKVEIVAEIIRNY